MFVYIQNKKNLKKKKKDEIIAFIPVIPFEPPLIAKRYVGRGNEQQNRFVFLKLFFCVDHRHRMIICFQGAKVSASNNCFLFASINTF